MIKRFELALMLGATGLVAIASLYFNAFDRLSAFVLRHDDLGIDEGIVVLLFCGIVAFILLVRRARDLGQEVERRQESEEVATKLARHDPLTGLPNRRVLMEDLGTALHAVRSSAEQCAVFLIDLDLFKPVNDIHGHAVGDAVLIEVAGRITKAVAGRGVVARMGGDEFACVLPCKTSGDLSTRVASQILRAVSQPIFIEGARVQLGSTIGIACAPHDGTSPGELLRAADLAMYEGKREGRGSYRFFHVEMGESARERIALEGELRNAISAGEIVPYFQPVTLLVEAEIIGFEALARWLHPTRGLIPPDSFIPIAEDIGLIDELSYAMLRLSCIAARAWPPSLWLSINISPVQLKDPWLPSRLLAILTETGFAPGRLIVEVTENAIIDDMEGAREVFCSLQSAGVRIALDDFGKGYSSLYHLRQLRFDHLKIDGSFVHAMDSPESVKIVKAVTGLGQSLGMPVTAEGVETRAEAEALRDLGCEHAQGFLFGKPLDAVGTAAMLRRLETAEDEDSLRRAVARRR